MAERKKKISHKPKRTRSARSVRSRSKRSNPARKASGKKTGTSRVAQKTGSIKKRKTAPSSRTGAQTGSVQSREKPKMATAKKRVSAKRSVKKKTAGTRGGKKPPAKKPRGAPSKVRRKTKSAPRRLSKRDMEFYRKLLLQMRDRVTDGISFLARENLNNSQQEQSGDLSNYGIHMADHGTDNFDREIALSMVSNEQDLIYEIDEALARIDAGTYGLCEMTGQPIERSRLKAIPYARYSLQAQEEMEKGRGRYRSFGSSMARGSSL